MKNNAQDLAVNALLSVKQDEESKIKMGKILNQWAENIENNPSDSAANLAKMLVAMKQSDIIKQGEKK